jgi:hypothetical protein
MLEVITKGNKTTEKPDQFLKLAFEDTLITKETEINKYAQNDVKDDSDVEED